MTEFPFKPGRAFAQSLDLNDPLKSFRNEFAISDPSLIYMDGNSLGRLPRRTIDRASPMAVTEMTISRARDMSPPINSVWESHAASRKPRKKFRAQRSGKSPGQPKPRSA